MQVLGSLTGSSGNVVRIIAISDTHGFHRNLTLPEGDVLVHAGDATGKGEIDVALDFADWFAAQPHRHKIFVPGNHDSCFDISHPKYDERSWKALDDRGVHYLHDTSRTLDGIKFYGSPWVPHLPAWAFWDRDRDRFERAPTDIDVLVTHAPPRGIRDGHTNSMHSGSPHIVRFLRRCARLRVHVFGHVHEAQGRSDLGDIAFVNASICTRLGTPTNAPTMIEL